ncbi:MULTISPECIES: serine hydrolase [Actinoalloteichus]|uniref:Beta-lactamase enzyme family n=1 Tax=Actinoalloteichus fjordicus TaxID=1612552 RepID=A0AAC9LE63_9PSEU|nr:MULTISPECIES: serine hydrolase [Actinoalloteichus]APU16308.1 Beta-lactamase enzyme family [Actinoalloteichus fjordicus]APU22367.1 Beta-lactamase enzyme family [Actinoalloteichus sp. GBA129-24]
MRWQPFLLSGLLLFGTGCGASSASTPPSAGADSPVESTSSAASTPGEDLDWWAYLAENSESVGLVFDDGRGTTWSTGADEPKPFASTRKILHLAAYSLAVADGEIDPASTVTLGEWEAYYLEGTDGGAHPAALEELGIDPADKDQEVPIDDVVHSMIKFSDNTGTDLLRDRIGDQRMLDAAARIGWEPTELPNFLGAAIALLMPEHADEGHDALAERYLADEEFRSAVLEQKLPNWDEQVAWAEELGRVEPRHIDELHRRLVEDGLGEQAAAEIAVPHLSWTQLEGVTAKGGSFPGQLSDSWALRHDDGTLSSITFVITGMSMEDWGAGLGGGHQMVIYEALQDPEAAERLREAVGAE